MSAALVYLYPLFSYDAEKRCRYTQCALVLPKEIAISNHSNYFSKVYPVKILTKKLRRYISAISVLLLLVNFLSFLNSMSAVITLSSSSDDEESISPPKKRVKLTPAPKSKQKSNDVVVLSDGDDSGLSVKDDSDNTESKVNGFKEITLTPIKKQKRRRSSDDDLSIVETSTPSGSKQKVSVNYKNAGVSVTVTEDKKASSDEDLCIIDDCVSVETSKTETTILLEKNTASEVMSSNESEQTIVVETRKIEDVDSVSEQTVVEVKSIEKETVENIVTADVEPIVNGSKSDPSGNAKPSTSHSFDPSFTEFLDSCRESIKGSKFEILRDKFHILMKLYKKCGPSYSESFNFKKFLKEAKEKAAESSMDAVLSFNEVLDHLKTVIQSESIDVDKNERIKLKKLEKTIKKLVKVIKRLEEEEIDFSDEEDSSFLKIHRYMDRLRKVHEKYCQLLKKNPHSGRIMYDKLGFVSSEYNEINLAINKKYKNSNKFPSYNEIETYIKKCVQDSKLDLTEDKIKSESLHCFKKLGELMQTRRRRDLYDTHFLYIQNTDDPASRDAHLYTMLNSNSVIGKSNIDKVYDEFVKKQDEGKPSNEDSEDSDNSNYVDSEPEIGE